MNHEIEEILRIGQNQFNIQQLASQVKTSYGVLPFVGAGLSVPFEFKGWQDFLLGQAVGVNIESQVRQRVESGEYEEAAEDVFSRMGNLAFQDALLEAYGPQKLEGLTLKGTVCLLPRITRGPVVTTNFDRILEAAFAKFGTPFESVVWGANLPQATVTVHQNRRCLLKLHGDVTDHSNRVLTLTEYAKHYGATNPAKNTFKKDLPKLLQFLLISRPVLFLGCSLKNDRVIKLLRNVTRAYPDLVHYAVAEMPQTPGQDAFVAARLYFSEHRIRPIWYPNGKHDFVETIVRFLAESVSGTDSPKKHSAKASLPRTHGADAAILGQGLKHVSSTIEDEPRNGKLESTRDNTDSGLAKANKQYDSGNYATALQLLLSAADLGNGEAMYNLGLMYQLGSGVNQDLRQARRWYLLSARRRESAAMNALGLLHEQGESVPENPLKAAIWYRRALMAGDLSAAHNTRNVPEDTEILRIYR